MPRFDGTDIDPIATQPIQPEIALYDTKSPDVRIVTTPKPLTLQAMARLGLGLVNTALLYETTDQD